jgi:NADH-quinone oxidoreductase subunit L
MVARSHVLFERSPVALPIVAWVGGLTALYAATVALAQTDIKRVLAYSTISQLGYMFAAVGVGAYAAGIFHLVTHAFFKALLFLGAGSVIHALDGEQDLRRMGGLAPRMVVTTVTMAVGAAGLAGLPPLAGFFSKDQILEAVYEARFIPLWTVLLVGAFLTSVYAFRLLFLAFFGGPRMSKEVAHHAHESPGVMTGPLLILAGLTIVAGFVLGVPSAQGTPFARFLAPVFPVPPGEHGGVGAYVLLALSFVVVLAGVLLATLNYLMRPVRADTIGQPRTAVHALLLNAYYVDRLYDAAVVRPGLALMGFLASAVDVRVFDGAVNGIGRAVLGWARGLRRLQTGYVANYALTMLLGAVALLAFLVAR